MHLDLMAPAGNPSSVHWFGRRAKSQLIEARDTLKHFFHSHVEEIIFTSGATESLNFLLRGLPQGHIISTTIEHSAIFETLKSLEATGQKVTFLPVDEWGAPSPDEVESAITSDTRAIVLTLSNGETGVKIDLDQMSRIAEAHSIPLILDAVSYIGKEPFQLLPGIKAVALSGHKFHGPKGVGALYLHRSLKLKGGITGGPQEHLKRAGTENLPGILGLAEAIKIVEESQETITKHLKRLQSRLEEGLIDQLGDCFINGSGPRICNTTNIAFMGVDGEALLIELDLAGIAVSHGSACSSGSLEPSRVLSNMGFDRKRARSSIRFSLSRMNTIDEIDDAVSIISSKVKKLRQISV